MINGPSVYDSVGSATTPPSPAVYDFDKKNGIYGVGLSKKALKSGWVVAESPESYTEGPFIMLNSVRKSNFCTEILIKLRPLAIARTSLIYALLIMEER